LVERVKEAAYTADGSRAVGANMGWISPISPRTPMSDVCIFLYRFIHFI